MLQRAATPQAALCGGFLFLKPLCDFEGVPGSITLNRIVLFLKQDPVFSLLDRRDPDVAKEFSHV